MSDTTKNVLDGVRVLDFGRYIAGPYCAALLADFGADVIRIERLDGGEDRFVVPVTEGGDGAGFLQLARNKRGMTLNPMKPEGREVVKKLVKSADVVVANLPDQALTAMGLDYETLSEINPRVILAATSAFGPVGPYAKKLGFDGLAQAMSGAMHLTGDAAQPTKSYVNFLDFGTASLSAFGIMAALAARQESGKGQKVETSLLSTALNFGNSFLIEQAVNKVDRRGSVNRAQNSGPGDCFRTKDGWIMSYTIGSAQLKRWCDMVERPDILQDPNFATDQLRGDNGEILSDLMSQWCATRTTEEILKKAEELGVPMGPVLTPQEALDHPQMQAREEFLPMDYPGLQTPAPIANTPIRLSETPGLIRHRAPTLGEHTEAILKDLGYTGDEISELRDKRIIS